MSRAPRTGLHRHTSVVLSELDDIAISKILGNSSDAGLPNCATRSESISLAVRECAHLIEIERLQPGSVKFKSKIVG